MNNTQLNPYAGCIFDNSEMINKLLLRLQNGEISIEGLIASHKKKISADLLSELMSTFPSDAEKAIAVKNPFPVMDANTVINLLSPCIQR